MFRAGEDWISYCTWENEMSKAEATEIADAEGAER
jgi:hypothetical protein